MSTTTRSPRATGPAGIARRATLVEAKRVIREHGDRHQRAELERLDRSSQSTSSKWRTDEERRVWRLAKRAENAAAIIALAAKVRR